MRRGSPNSSGQLEVDVEELGPQLQRAHVGVEVADVEAPQDGPLDLGPALAADLVEVGVVPDVLHRAREPAVAAEQRRGVGDGAPAVQLVLRVEREVDPDVLAPVAAARLPGPRAGHHQRGAGDRPRGEALVDADVGRVARAEVVGVDDDQLGVGRRSRAAGPGSAQPSLRPLLRTRRRPGPGPPTRSPPGMPPFLP